MQAFEYKSPTSLADVWSCLDGADGAARLPGGRHRPRPRARNGRTCGRTPSSTSSGCPSSRVIEVLDDEGLRIGALTTLHALARSAEVADRFPVLAEVAGTTASYQVRNRGTVGGNLCLDTRCSYFNQSPFWRAEYPDCRKMGGGSCYVVPAGDGCHALSSCDLATPSDRAGRRGRSCCRGTANAACRSSDLYDEQRSAGDHPRARRGAGRGAGAAGRRCGGLPPFRPRARRSTSPWPRWRWRPAATWRGRAW